MTVAELQQILRAVDRSAVLVSSRILERVLREELALPNSYWKVPHAASHVCDRQVLFRHAEQADLELGPGELLPDTVILLTRPAAEELSNLERQNVLLKYWRRLFHARVHMALRGPPAGRGLSEAELRERVDAIGPVEFEEVRNVLIEDNLLPDNADVRMAYVELAAVYLELRYFAATLLPNYFPGVRDFRRLEKLLTQDVDAADLYAQTRLADAPDPVAPMDTRSDESQEAYWKLVRSGERAAQKGNLVGAAILRMRASRIAPAAKTGPTRQEAERDIRTLGDRLGAALRLTDAEKDDWARYLTLLLDKADQGVRPTEAKVLQDLQKACLDYEQEIYTVDLVEWVMSAGKRAVMQPLPSQRLVRINNHLRSAIGRLNEVRLADADRGHLTRLMQTALGRGEEALRARFGPVLRTAMEDVGLRPRGPVATAAFEKVIAELIDRISRHGFLTFMELRDTLSRNQLKIPDLTEPDHFIRGDPLIRLDRRLAALLDGVYRSGEIYARWLERSTSLLFGTSWGRALTLYLLLPLLSAWGLLHVLGMALELCFSKERFPEVHHVALVLLGPANMSSSAAEAAPGPEPPAEAPSFFGGDLLADPTFVSHLVVLALVALFMVAVYQSPPFRRYLLRLLILAWRQVYHALFVLPLRLVPLETIKRVVNSWLFQLLSWTVLKPGLMTLVIYLMVPQVFRHTVSLPLVFLMSLFLLNSRLGRVTTEATQDGLMQLAEKVRSGLLRGLVRFIVEAFKQLVEGIEYLIFLVDEWLRFRSGESRLSLIIRTAASVIWAPVAFFIRFYMVVLIEPGINPVKFPISSLAAKIVYPVTIALGLESVLMEALSPVVGYYLAWAFVIPTLFFLPDVFGYLAWEMKENWGLYRSNRSKTVQPVSVGPHGETVRGLLQPGFHSGTVPRVFARLRAAERRAIRTRNWHPARAYRHEVEEITRALEKFVQREVLALLQSSRSFADFPVSLGPVKLGTNRIRITFHHAPEAARPVEVELYFHQGWIVGHLGETGWLDRLSPAQARAFSASLAYLYRLSDVELVYEYLRARFGPVPPAPRLVPEGLELRQTPDSPPVLHLLRGELEHPERAPEIKRLVFARAPITWNEWEAAWQKDAAGEGHPGLPGLGDLIWPWPLPDGGGAPSPDATLHLGPPPRPSDETLPLRPGKDGAAAPSPPETPPAPLAGLSGEPPP